MSERETLNTQQGTGLSTDVNSDPIKPLSHKWTLWFDNAKLAKSGESWEDNLKEIMTVGTVGEFWGMFNNLMPASRLQTGSNYHLFRAGVKPMWEDPNNIKGGKWVVSLPAKGDTRKLDDCWLRAVLSAIGETLDETSDVQGLVASLRKSQHRVSVWTKTAHDADLQMSLGQNLRSGLALPKKTKLTYQAHADAANTGSSFMNKPLYEA